MDQSIPTAAVYAGSLARTYEYRTTGVPTTPAIRWSYAPRLGARVTCPILVAQDRVYVADSAGYLTVLDAPSGDLVWSFPTDWVENPSKTTYGTVREGVVAFCLDETLALGYVASAHDSVYELDLPTGQVVRSWHVDGDREDSDEEDLDEEDIFDVQDIRALYLYRDELWLLGCTDYDDYHQGIFRLDRRTGIVMDMVPIDQERCEYAPAVYLDPGGQADLIFGCCVYNNNGETTFVAVDLAAADPQVVWGVEDEAIWVREEPDKASLKRARRYCPNSWTTPYWVIDEPGNATPKRVDGALGSLDLLESTNTPVMDGVLYVPGAFDAEAERWNGLLALDPREGTVKWYATVPSDILWYGSPMQLVAADYQIFLLLPDQVRSIDVQTHQARWIWEAPLHVGHAFVADSLLYVLGEQGAIFALETSTGTRRWSWQVEGEILRDWSTIGNGTLYLATTQALYALRS